MRVSKISAENIENLKQLIGGQIISIFIEGGRFEKGDGVVLDGYGMISISIQNGKRSFKLRLKFHEEKDSIFYTEFYEWEISPSIKERYNPKTGVVNYDYVLDEDLKKYPLSIAISPKDGEDHMLCNQIKSIKIYHYESKYEDGSDCDFVALIEFETETGRSVIIEDDDPMHTFYIYLDELTMRNARLAEVHDDAGETYGKKRYQLRHEIH